MQNEQGLLYGVVDGLYYTNQTRHQELNDRIYDRYLPSATLQPMFSSRPSSSKYAYLPILEQRTPSTVPVYNFGTFHPEKTFNPGTDKAPWRGFAENINVESTLRNQFFALQKNNQAVYVPSSNSDLYVVPVDSRYVEQPNPYLFENGATNFAPTQPSPNGLGKLVFENFTRNQLKETPCTYDGRCTGDSGGMIPRDGSQHPATVHEGYVNQSASTAAAAQTTSAQNARTGRYASSVSMKQQHITTPFSAMRGGGGRGLTTVGGR